MVRFWKEDRTWSEKKEGKVLPAIEGRWGRERKSEEDIKRT